MFIYVFINLVYLWLLLFEIIVVIECVVGDVLEVVLDGGGKVVVFLIGVFVFGIIVIYMMLVLCIYFVMVCDGVFFEQFVCLNEWFKILVNVMVVQVIWVIFLFLLWGKFYDLIIYVIFIDIVFMMLVGLGIFLFCKCELDVVWFYCVWGYFIIFGFYVLIICLFLINIFIEKFK